MPATTIEDAARALATELATRHTDGRRLALLRRLADWWPDLGWRLRDVEDATTATPPATPPPGTPAHYRENADARANRQYKAGRIAAWADETVGLDAAQLAALLPYLRPSKLATDLGINTPSADTLRRAVELLAERDAIHHQADAANAGSGEHANA